MSRSDPTNLQPFVDRLLARSVLTPDEIQAILALPVHPVEVRGQTDFVQVNEKTSCACFIASGMVARFGETRDGQRQITAFHIPGDMVDLNSVVRPIAVGGLTTLCNTTILEVPHTAIRALAVRYPAVAEAFWRDTMLDAAILMQWVVNVGKQRAKTRLAHIFCEMAIRLGGDRQILQEYDFPVSQERLAEAAGMTGVHVNRSLKALREEGLVTVKRYSVKIHDWQRLAQTGEFEADYLVADTGTDRRARLLAGD
ncbi:Crp/Fnr family transcriptional regulator [Glacieibacterium frigidum]|uniref:Crp/Fnr family transcriptional regulator n=1 Tax=Glacieibacterium frigidum TaxID=2593303 RepID=A0A552U949_9SPHN|nr:Crp/Fnr family transcriptional regulator [Glacieibacterium frigidum]TRW14754.1 Crp/Fnr family transcriptional regulator [Glacieibacterium frigidum]